MFLEENDSYRMFYLLSIYPVETVVCHSTLTLNKFYSPYEDRFYYTRYFFSDSKGRYFKLNICFFQIYQNVGTLTKTQFKSVHIGLTLKDKTKRSIKSFLLTIENNFISVVLSYSMLMELSRGRMRQFLESKQSRSQSPLYPCPAECPFS